MRRGIIVAIGAVIAANAFVLIHAARNRDGDPDAVVTLTDKQLSLSSHLGEDNTGMFLQLKWRDAFPPNYDWRNLLMPPKPMFVALETQEPLLVVDAARSADELRRKYPDRQKYIVMRGTTRLSSPPWFTRLLVPESQVPRQFRQALENAHGHYLVTLKYGRYYEPWIADVRPVTDK
jgi:hypothetical protein